jgi:hypothetical protein
MEDTPLTTNEGVSENVPVLKPSVLGDYLFKISPLLLDCSDDESKALESFLQQTDTLFTLKKFIEDVKSPVLFVEKKGTSFILSAYWASE